MDLWACLDHSNRESGGGGRDAVTALAFGAVDSRQYVLASAPAGLSLWLLHGDAHVRRDEHGIGTVACNGVWRCALHLPVSRLGWPTLPPLSIATGTPRADGDRFLLPIFCLVSTDRGCEVLTCEVAASSSATDSTTRSSRSGGARKPAPVTAAVDATPLHVVRAAVSLTTAGVVVLSDSAGDVPVAWTRDGALLAFPAGLASPHCTLALTSTPPAHVLSAVVHALDRGAIVCLLSSPTALTLTTARLQPASRTLCVSATCELATPAGLLPLSDSAAAAVAAFGAVPVPCPAPSPARAPPSPSTSAAKPSRSASRSSGRQRSGPAPAAPSPSADAKAALELAQWSILSGDSIWGFALTALDSVTGRRSFQLPADVWADSSPALPPPTGPGHSDPVVRVAVYGSPCSATPVCASVRPGLRAPAASWLRCGEPECTPGWYCGGPASLAVSAAASLSAAVHHDGAVVVWDSDTGDGVCVLGDQECGGGGGGPGPPARLWFHPHLPLLFVAGSAGHVHVFVPTQT